MTRFFVESHPVGHLVSLVDLPLRMVQITSPFCTKTRVMLMLSATDHIQVQKYCSTSRYIMH